MKRCDSSWSNLQMFCLDFVFFVASDINCFAVTNILL